MKEQRNSRRPELDEFRRGCILMPTCQQNRVLDELSKEEF
jgi:hypothetical protein